MEPERETNQSQMFVNWVNTVVGFSSLPENVLFRWSDDDDEWQTMKEDIADFDIDSSNDRLWLRPSKGGPH